MRGRGVKIQYALRLSLLGARGTGWGKDEASLRPSVDQVCGPDSVQDFQERRRTDADYSALALAREASGGARMR